MLTHTKGITTHVGPELKNSTLDLPIHLSSGLRVGRCPTHKLDFEFRVGAALRKQVKSKFFCKAGFTVRDSDRGDLGSS